eukprot:5629890-Prymnesium_polylepis.1
MVRAVACRRGRGLALHNRRRRLLRVVVRTAACRRGRSPTRRGLAVRRHPPRATARAAACR